LSHCLGEGLTEFRVCTGRVDLSGLDAGMPQELGQTLDWHLLFSHSPAKGMTQLVTGELDPGTFGMLFQEILNPCLTQGPSVLIQKEVIAVT
jgi:hypothetical protein